MSRHTLERQILTQFTDVWERWLTGRRSRWAVALSVQALVLAGYVALAAEDVVAIRYLLYPFVWIDVSAWAILRVTTSPGSRRHRLVAATFAGGYLISMLFVAGFVGHGHAEMTGLRVIAAPPGWGPMIAYQSPLIRLYLVPFQLVGYVGLAYLLYAAVLDATRAAFGGVLGLVSCVGCTWSLVGPMVASTVGATSTVGSTLYAWSYDLTTVVFIVTVGLLLWANERGGDRQEEPGDG